MENVQIGVKGMTCGGCQAAVQKALSQVAGVERAEVDLAGAKASVAYDGAKASLQDLERAVREAGFEVA